MVRSKCNYQSLTAAWSHTFNALITWAHRSCYLASHVTQRRNEEEKWHLALAHICLNAWLKFTSVLIESFGSASWGANDAKHMPLGFSPMKNPACLFLSLVPYVFSRSPQFPPQCTGCLLFSKVPSAALTSWGPARSGGGQSEPHTFLAPGPWLLKKCVCVCGMGVFSREPHTRLSHPVNLQIRECTLLCALSNWPWWHLPRKLFSKAHHSSYPRALSFLSFLFKGFFFSTTAYILPQDSSSTRTQLNFLCPTTIMSFKASP